MWNKNQMLHEIVIYILNNTFELGRVEKRHLSSVSYNPPTIYNHFLGKVLRLLY